MAGIDGKCGPDWEWLVFWIGIVILILIHLWFI